MKAHRTPFSVEEQHMCHRSSVIPFALALLLTILAHHAALSVAQEEIVRARESQAGGEGDQERGRYRRPFAGGKGGQERRAAGGKGGQECCQCR